MTEADSFEDISRGVPGIGVGRQLEWKHHILFCGQTGQKLKRLKNKSHQATAQRGAGIFIEGGDFGAVNDDVAARGSIQPGHQAKQRRFARPRCSNDSEAGAGFNGKIDVGQQRQLAFGNRHALDHIGNFYG